jgi:hypothetical protein
VADTPQHPNDPSTTRFIVVAGSGRSGTSTVAGVLKYLGVQVPTPEVPPNKTNPLGFFEPKWVVDYQTKLLAQAGVRISDARPQAFERCHAIGQRPNVQQQVREWLGPVLAAAPETVVKDPRSVWFLPMWTEAAATFGVAPSFLTMLRHPAEVVGSKSKYYGKTLGGGVSVRTEQTSRAAGWLNVTLFAEAATREAPRAFVRYDDLLEDWRIAITQAATDLDLTLQHGLPEDGAAEVDAFIDPSLHRVTSTWDDIEIPAPVIELCDEVWELANSLVDDPSSDESRESRLDETRRRYVELYAEAEAIAHSSVDAPRSRGAKQAGGTTAPAATPADASQPPRSLPRRAAGRARRAWRSLSG